MSIALPGPLLLVGAGKMGGALLQGLLQRGFDPANIRVQDPAPSPEIVQDLAQHGITIEPEIANLPEPPAVIIAAVKPQLMDSVFPSVAKLAGPATLTLSIAAGRTIASFARHLPPQAAIVRAMPNTPAAIGRGMTVCTPNAHVTEHQHTLAEALMAAVGEVAWVDDEALLDPVTAVSGSGPAYVFLLAEALARAGAASGLDPDVAQHLARTTITGAAELMARSELSPEVLRANVTSPGGTTAAALEVLMGPGGLDQLLGKAVAAATARSRSLAG